MEQGRIRHFQAHLERLGISAAAIGQPTLWLAGQTEAIADWVAGTSIAPLETLRLRLHGDQLWALLEPLVETPSPYRLKLAPHPLGTATAHPLAPHKGLMGTWNAEPLTHATAAGADDALLFWPDGTLVETAIASIALEVGGSLWVPPLEGRVASLAERIDLPGWAASRDIHIQAFQTTDLGRGRLWCFNAVRGVWLGTLL